MWEHVFCSGVDRACRHGNCPHLWARVSGYSIDFKNMIGCAFIRTSPTLSNNAINILLFFCVPMQIIYTFFSPVFWNQILSKSLHNAISLDGLDSHFTRWFRIDEPYSYVHLVKCELRPSRLIAMWNTETNMDTWDRATRWNLASTLLKRSLSSHSHASIW